MLEAILGKTDAPASDPVLVARIARLAYDDHEHLKRLNEDLVNARKVDADFIARYGNPNA